MNVGIVYDGGIRDNGTPYYTRVALAKVLGRDPEWWTEAAPIDVLPGAYDFFIHVDDGRDDLGVDNIPHPWGYWVVDSHLGPDIRIEKAKKAGIVWCAQRPFVEELAKHGVKASWLPLACEPLHHPTADELNPDDKYRDVKAFDLAFVGYMQSPRWSNRLNFLHELFLEFPNSWFEFGAFHQKMAAIYHRARIGINHAVRSDLNMRFFELASMGVPQLADSRMVGLSNLGFEPGVHYIPYESTFNALEQIKGWLGSERLQDIAAEALSLVRSGHTYEHRVRRMLDDISAGGF